MTAPGRKGSTTAKSWQHIKRVGLGRCFPIKDLAIFVACVNLITAAEPSFRGSAVALGLVLVVFAIPVVALIGLYAAPGACRD